MTKQLDLLTDYRPRIANPDVCAGKHHGNPKSEAANLKTCKQNDRAMIMALIETAKDGKTLKELCADMGRTPNAISGRITELKMTGRIEVRGSRDGCGINYSIQTGGL